MTAESPRAITLPDGRRLTYAEYGAPAGRPVMIFPGTPGSHVLASVAAAPALARDIRIIAPDRPGIGGSDDQPGRRFSDWPADVAHLADALGCARFAVVGISGGGPYALASASRLADRVDGVAIVSGAGPYDEPGAFDGMPLHLRLTWTFVRSVPWLSNAVLRATGAGAARYPDRALSLLRQTVSEADRVVLGREDFRTLFRRDVIETFRQGPRGAAHDLALYAGSWDVTLADVSQRVHLWHGEADRVIPVGQGRHIAAALPRCVPSFVPGAGHFWFADHMDVVLDALLPDRQ
jgi:pimeloyl-ACP methyl ester carboxylesterase